MVGKFFELVNEAFGAIATKYNLQICENNSNVTIVVGPNYVLLVWLEREGVSVQYVNLADNKPEFINVGIYLLIQRQLLANDSVAVRGDHQQALLIDIRSYAQTLEKIAPDILNGDKQWLTDQAARTSRLRASHYESILRCIEQCRNSGSSFLGSSGPNTPR
jgi:hypothetical protein